MNINKLAIAWVELQKLDQKSERTNELSWASNELIRLVLFEFRGSWDVILEILASTDDSWVIANLGAGPLEELSRLYPVEFEASVKIEIKKNRKLKQAMTHVWL